MMMECPRLIMTVAIHWMPLIASTEQSVGNIGKVLLVAGQSECFQKTHCPEMPLHHRTANGGPDVRDHRTTYPSILFARAHRSRLPLPAIYRAIRTAIRDGRTAPMTRPGLTSSSQAPTCRAGVKIACTARTLATLSRCIPLAYWNEGRYHILFEYRDAPSLPWHAEHGILAEVGLSEFHHRDGLDVSMSLFSIVTFISHRSNDASTIESARSDAMRNHPPPQASQRQVWTLCWCARAGGLAKSEWAVRGKVGYDPSCKQAEEEFNKYTYTELALETKFGLIVEAFGYPSFRCAIPVIVVDHYVLVRMDGFYIVRVCVCVCVGLPRILRSIPDEVVEMMQRRVVFMFEEFFKSLSTQVHTALESARINLFSGDNAWQRAFEPAVVNPLPFHQPPLLWWDEQTGAAM
ncbi:hypothetical protein PTSG_10659 [Salpingoeca rosetta]|uniref:Uncharacterized protein n=1 Tax=Salpingoeca rosetta (strain ATCC 50818 / BSB-021) TaxID=946362 RepID=F2UQ06_SALR5|nr:uncharacterized protein PTSG_10659 [Salpingoeca rosetta]EGD79674.1 hypothetical protein PTSG_10659 [Salpingoeca rosetta]|eukprot:XP_004988624.1 hypothetical protein PTSG_10659 [Salpingoeca rosetta]